MYPNTPIPSFGSDIVQTGLPVAGMLLLATVLLVVGLLAVRWATLLRFETVG